jgi:4-hydroxy-tetrahydrodipicolinate reductase
MMNSGKRRIPFQKKVGTGLTEDVFREKIAKKEITGHVGLDISISLIANSLKWTLDEIIDIPPEPVIADKTLETSYTTVQPGYVAGLKDQAYGVMNGVRVINLVFVAHAGVDKEFDAIEIDGVPPLTMSIDGGVHGDTGTTAMVINSIPKVINALPGLYTMADLPIPSATPVELNKYIKN